MNQAVKLSLKTMMEWNMMLNCHQKPCWNVKLFTGNCDGMNYEVNLEAKQLNGLLPDLKKHKTCWITICRSFVKVLLFYSVFEYFYIILLRVFPLKIWTVYPQNNNLLKVALPSSDNLQFLQNTARTDRILLPLVLFIHTPVTHRISSIFSLLFSPFFSLFKLQSL